MKYPGRSIAAASFFILATASALAAPTPSSQSGFHIIDGKLNMNGSRVLGHFSIQAGSDFLFFYIPHFGLITVARAGFPGAKPIGHFEGKQLKFMADGTPFVLSASEPILTGGKTLAWVSVDRSYSLRVKSPTVGYGDNSNVPYDWPSYVRHSK